MFRLYAGRLTVYDYAAVRGKEFFSPFKSFGSTLGGPHILADFLMVKRNEHKAEHSPLLPRLKTNGAVSPFTLMPLWRAQGWSYLSNLPYWRVILRCWQRFDGYWSLLRSDVISAALNLKTLIAHFNIILIKARTSQTVSSFQMCLYMPPPIPGLLHAAPISSLHFILRRNIFKPYVMWLYIKHICSIGKLRWYSLSGCVIPFVSTLSK